MVLAPVLRLRGWVPGLLSPGLQAGGSTGSCAGVSNGDRQLAALKTAAKLDSSTHLLCFRLSSAVLRCLLGPVLEHMWGYIHIVWYVPLRLLEVALWLRDGHMAGQTAEARGSNRAAGAHMAGQVADWAAVRTSGQAAPSLWAGRGAQVGEVELLLQGRDDVPAKRHLQ